MTTQLYAPPEVVALSNADHLLEQHLKVIHETLCPRINKLSIRDSFIENGCVVLCIQNYPFEPATLIGGFYRAMADRLTPWYSLMWDDQYQELSFRPITEASDRVRHDGSV